MKTELDKQFEERYKELNKKQKIAVDTIEGPVLVVAGPGTGKTTVLTLRIANILKKTDTPANGILAITYTNAGVKAMREKLRSVIGNLAHDVCIHTFHSFANAMISEYPSHFLSTGDFRQISDVEEESIIKEIINKPKFKELRPLGRPDTYIYSIVRTIGDAKKDALTPKDVKKFAEEEIEKIKKDEENISTRGATKGELKAVAKDKIEKLEKTILFSEVYKEYEEYKQKSKLRDYDDLITELLITLREDELFLRLIQERFLYILVDEHQDTNDSQNFIISLISEFFKTPNIFVVGDEKQAIYRFQGASVENFLRFKSLWPEMKVISLEENYRSHQGILDASFSMIERNYSEGEHLDLRVKLKSANGSPARPVDIISSENTLAMEDFLLGEIKNIIKTEPKSKVAIITRRNRELERVLRVLEAENIPVSSERSVDIFHHPVGTLFFEFADFLLDPSKTDSLSRTIAFGMWGLSYKEAIALIDSIKRNSADLSKELPELVYIKNRMLKDGALGFLIESAERSGLINIISRDPAYVSVWRGIVTLAESLVRDGEIVSGIALLEEMKKYKESAESKSVKVSVGAPDLQVVAMTAHGSKGLEFDYVFIPYANEEAWIGKVWGSSFVLPEKNTTNHNVPDIRRLFYVAITRARLHTTILYSLEESDGRMLSPLRFLDELDSKSVKLEKLSRKDITISQNKVRKESEYDKLMTSVAKKVLLTKGLSVTALNHFMECPSKFLYESILKLPQAPSTSAEKGNAMHLAISNVWNLKEKKESNIEKTIVETVSEYLDKTLLSVSDKEALKKELVDDAPAVSRALLSHFNTNLNIASEKWIEVPFDTKYKDEKITISLHGKLDAILSSVDQVDVFDYKTRKSMSEKAIRGETASEDGNYFRQLVFYKILLNNQFQTRNKKVTTSLVFVSPDEKGRCPIITLPVTDAEMKTVEGEIGNLLSTVWSGELSNKFCDDPDCKYCGLRKLFKE